MHAIRSRRALVPGGPADRAVVVREGRIEAIVPPEDLPGGIAVADVGDHVLMPGIVDTHVHVNEPGRTEWEGFETATRAAAAGGVTTLVDMPLNSLPVTTHRDALHAKLDAASPRLWVDCGFWGGVVPDNASALNGLAAAGALGAKAFLCDSGIDEFPACGEAELRRAMAALGAAGIPLLAHAELAAPVEPPGVPATDYRAWLHSRPRAWEDAAIALLVRLCVETGCPVHIVHLSSATALPLLRAARSRGHPITVETCPHYLCLAAEEVGDGDTWFKCAPPIREASNRDLLWAGLAEGVIDGVVTDHSPCTPELKCPDTGDFMEAWGGIASLEIGLPAVWTAARARGHGLTDLVRWMCAAPARLAGLSHRKGALAVGLDADLVAFDPDATRVVDPAALHHRHPVTPYRGRTLHGAVTATWVRGQRVFDGEVADPPLGRPLLGRST